MPTHHCRLIVLAWLIMATASLAGPAKPLLAVTNNSMEEVNAGTGLPEGYCRFTPGLMESDPTVAFEGKRSLKVLLRGQRESVGIYQPVPSTVPEGMTVRFRVRVRLQDLDGQACLVIYRYPAPFSKEDPFYSTERLAGTKDWTMLEALVSAKKGGSQFQVRLMVDGTTGCVWWDQLEGSVEEKP